MTNPSVSVIVVSNGRPDDLALCLKGLAQLDYPVFEVVVVADQPSMLAVTATGLADRIKAVPFEDRNISAARNAGIAVAAGDVIAFIDDDAVPEPTWLRYLAAPFADGGVAAAGGFVIARNGISLQWGARMVFSDSTAVPMAVDTSAPVLHRAEPGRAIKTEGTNMAFRRDVLVRLGGFDPAYAFYLDETDLNMRLAAEGAVTAIVPMARVHHRFAASDRRNEDRVPRDLTLIGQSLATFLLRHGGGPVSTLTHAKLRAEQRDRLLRHMVTGRLMPGDVARLMRGFDAGWQAGLQDSDNWQRLETVASDFLPFVPVAFVRGMHWISGRIWQKSRLMAAAAGRVLSGQRVTLILLSPTALYHHVTFEPEGYWLQVGGQFGRAARSEPLFRVCGHRTRVRQETARVAEFRAIELEKSH